MTGMSARLGAAVAVVVGLGLAVAGCGSEPTGVTGSGEYETSQDTLTEMVAAAESDGDPLYCQQQGTEVEMAAWLRGDDDYVLLADQTLGMARDAEALTLWNTEEGMALELLGAEVESMGLDLSTLGSATVFGNLIESGSGTLECRTLSDESYPALDTDTVTVYTMNDVVSGDLPQDLVSSFFASFGAL